MSRRELHALVRDLRQYLEWQAVPLSGAVPASENERVDFDTANRVRHEIKLRAALDDQPPAAKSEPPKARSEQPKAKGEKKPAALWKDASFGSKPQRTFASEGDEVQASRPRPENASDNLAAVRTELGDCKRCGLCEGRTNIVFGVGSPSARLMFVGEAPGFHEDKQGEPFVGKAGELLDKMIQAMGYQRSDVYIANVIKCRPPENRDPTPEEVAKCSPFLQQQIDAIRPEVLVALGKFAGNTLAGTDGPLNHIRGRWHTYQGIPCMVTFHPAYLLRNQNDKRRAWDDLQKVMAKLKS